MKKRLQTLAVLGAGAVLLTGCMQGGEAAEVDPAAFADPVAGEVPEGSLEGTSMTFVSWGGGFQNVQEEAFSTPFAETTGATLLSDGPTDMAKLQAQVEAGHVSWDVVNAAPNYATAHCDTLFEKLDYDLIDVSKIPEGMPQGECYVPSLSYSYTFFYDADTYGDNPPTSWQDFFDTEKFPGTRGIDGRATPTGGTYEAALLADGVAPEDLYPLDTARAIDTFRSIDDSLVFWTSGAEQTQMIQGGEVDMIMGWSGRVFEANQSGTNFAPVWNQGFMANDSFSIAKGSKNVTAAHAYINFALGEAQQAQMAEGSSYSPVNTDSEPALSPEAQEFNVARPEVVEQSLTANPEYWGPNLDQLSADWQGFINS